VAQVLQEMGLSVNEYFEDNDSNQDNDKEINDRTG
jgi:hypothetical protein